MLRFSFIISVKIRGTCLFTSVEIYFAYLTHSLQGKREENRGRDISCYGKKHQKKKKKKNRDDYYRERLQLKLNGVSRCSPGFCANIALIQRRNIGALYNCGGNGAVNRVWQPPGPEVITALYYWYNSITKVLGDLAVAWRCRPYYLLSATIVIFYSLETPRSRPKRLLSSSRARCSLMTFLIINYSRWLRGRKSKQFAPRRNLPFVDAMDIRHYGEDTPLFLSPMDSLTNLLYTIDFSSTNA